MYKLREHIFVFWGNNFEEAATVTFVTEFRDMGFKVKLVGLTPFPVSGAYGLALIPDLSLAQALPLANQTMCIIIPSTVPNIRKLENDPRIIEFLQEACINHPLFVIGLSRSSNVIESQILLSRDLYIYPNDESLRGFVRDLGCYLKNSF